MASAAKYWQQRMERQLYRSEQSAFHFEVNLLRQIQQAKRDVSAALKELLTKPDGSVYSASYLRQKHNLDLSSLSEVDIDRLFPGYKKVTEGGASYLVRGDEVLEVSRQMVLDRQLEYSVQKLRDYEAGKMKDLLGDVYQDSYYHAIYDFQTGVGYGFNFTVLDTHAIKRAVEGKWFDRRNYSDRIWQDKANLERVLKKTITQGIIKGEDIGKMIGAVEHFFGVDYTSAQRLVRTEVNHIYNQASLDSYAEGGVEKYRILATLDSKTSKICQQQDGREYLVSEMKPGVNAPPFHPNCRTITIPVVEWNDVTVRAARDPVTGKTVSVSGDLTYDEWAKQYGQKAPENIVKSMTAQAEQEMEDDSQKEAILRQGGFESFQINDHLWNGTDIPEYDMQAIEKIDSAIAKVKTPEDLKVYRGVGQIRITDILGIPHDSSLEDIVKALDGRETIRDRAFMSTSTDPDIASSFGTDGVHVQMEIDVQKGRSAFPMYAVNGHDEKEILLPRDTRMKIDRYEVVDGILKLFLKY